MRTTLTRTMAAGVVISSLTAAGVPWIVVGVLTAFVSLLIFVDRLAFSPRPEPTERVVKLVRAVQSPSSPPGRRRNHRRTKPPGQP